VFSSWFRTRTSVSCAVRGTCQFTSLLANVFRQSGASLWVRPCCLISVEQIWRTWQAVVGFRGFTNFACVIIKHSHNKWFCLNAERKRSTILLLSSSAVPVQSRSRQLTVLLMPDAVDTVTWAPDDGWRYHPKHVERFTDINKLYIVASCRTIIGIYFTMHGPLNVNWRYLLWNFIQFPVTSSVFYSTAFFNSFSFYSSFIDRYQLDTPTKSETKFFTLAISCPMHSSGHQTENITVCTEWWRVTFREVDLLLHSSSCTCWAPKYL